MNVLQLYESVKCIASVRGVLWTRAGLVLELKRADRRVLTSTVQGFHDPVTSVEVNIDFLQYLCWSGNWNIDSNFGSRLAQ